MNFRISILTLFALFVAHWSVCQKTQHNAEHLSIKTKLSGNYTNEYTSFLRIECKYNRVFIVPSFKRGIYVVNISHPEALTYTEIFSGVTKPLSYDLDESKNIISLHWEGEKLLKKQSEKLSPIEQLTTNSQSNAISHYTENPDQWNRDRLFSIGVFILDSLPSQIQSAQGIFEIITAMEPKNPDGYYQLGRSYMALNKRVQAKYAFHKSIKLKGGNKAQASYYLSVINGNIPKSHYPSINFDKLFAIPTLAEIAAIKEEWNEKSFPSKGKIELDTIFKDNGFDGRLKVLSYFLDGKTNYGAIFIPDHEIGQSLPAIVEAKGIDWKYTGLELSYRPKLAAYLDEEANKFIYIIPSVRGETLTFLDKEFKGEGLPNDGWEGATDDYLAFFNVACHFLGDKLDQSRIVAFGDSRGGTIAMLAAIRDKRFSSVINWAGPIDWINHMNGLDGITLKEQVILGLNGNILPQSGTPGQFIDWYFYEGSTYSQEHIRHKVIASSPLYFLDELNCDLMIHYGKEDMQVPIQNAYSLINELKKLNNDSLKFRFYFHENIGHNLNPYEAISETCDYLSNVILNKKHTTKPKNH